MLVPLDGSELAELIFTYARELAGRLDLDIVILHVSTPEEHAFTAMHRAYIERVSEMVMHQSAEVQQRTGVQSGGKVVEARGELTVGHPAEEIIRYADESDIDFILMATHGHSGVKRWAIGSVADKILRASKVPVWLVRAGIPDETVYDRWPTRMVLVPLDGSKLAESVLPHVETLVKQRGAELVDVVLLRVCEPMAIPTYDEPEVSGVPWNWGEYMDQEVARGKQAANEYLTRIEKRLKDSSISARSVVLEGKAADVIVDYAQKNPFNLIVMATHGRSGLSRWVYGSVAENILQGVSSPIFLVKPQQSNSSTKKEE